MNEIDKNTFILAVKGYAAGFAEGLKVKDLSKEEEEKIIQDQIRCIGIAGMETEKELNLKSEETAKEQQIMIQIIRDVIEDAFKAAREEEQENA